MRIVESLFLLSWLLKPYYLTKSGSIQLGDMFFILSFILLLLFNKNSNNPIFKTVDKKLIVFLISVIFINTFYSLIYTNLIFIRNTTFYIYNFCVVLSFRYLSNDYKFLERLSKISKFNIIVQLGIYLVGVGRWQSARYIGTFNDPNQLSFYVFSLFLVIFLISNFSKEINSKNNNWLVYFAIVIYILLKSASTGMILGTIIFTIIYLSTNVFSLKIKNVIKHILITISILSMLLVFVRFFDVSFDFENAFWANRLLNKFNRYMNSNHSTFGFNISAFMTERGIDKVIEYPWYIIWGAGEGLFTRFSNATTSIEIHSTPFAILFYYGIIPTLFLIAWIRDNLKGLDKILICVYVALLVESFTLYNHRQPLFWVLIILGKVLTSHSYKKS